MVPAFWGTRALGIKRGQGPWPGGSSARGAHGPHGPLAPEDAPCGLVLRLGAVQPARPPAPGLGAWGLRTCSQRYGDMETECPPDARRPHPQPTRKRRGCRRAVTPQQTASPSPQLEKQAGWGRSLGGSLSHMGLEHCGNSELGAKAHSHHPWGQEGSVLTLPINSALGFGQPPPLPPAPPPALLARDSHVPP